MRRVGAALGAASDVGWGWALHFHIEQRLTPTSGRTASVAISLFSKLAFVLARIKAAAADAVGLRPSLDPSCDSKASKGLASVNRSPKPNHRHLGSRR